MGDKITEEQKDARETQIKDWLKTWQQRLGLQKWRINIHFLNSRKKKGEDSVVGDVSADWKYLHASMTYYHPVIDTTEDDEVEQACVHELTHIFLEELKNCARQDYQSHVERVTTSIALAFRFAFEAGVEEGKALKIKKIKET